MKGHSIFLSFLSFWQLKVGAWWYHNFQAGPRVPESPATHTSQIQVSPWSLRWTPMTLSHFTLVTPNWFRFTVLPWRGYLLHHVSYTLIPTGVLDIESSILYGLLVILLLFQFLLNYTSYTHYMCPSLIHYWSFYSVMIIIFSIGSSHVRFLVASGPTNVCSFSQVYSFHKQWNWTTNKITKTRFSFTSKNFVKQTQV